jgi:hypothetical protein
MLLRFGNIIYLRGSILVLLVVLAAILYEFFLMPDEFRQFAQMLVFPFTPFVFVPGIIAVTVFFFVFARDLVCDIKSKRVKEDIEFYIFGFVCYATLLLFLAYVLYLWLEGFVYG